MSVGGFRRKCYFLMGGISYLFDGWFVQVCAPKVFVASHLVLVEVVEKHPVIERGRNLPSAKKIIVCIHIERRKTYDNFIFSSFTLSASSCAVPSFSYSSIVVP